MAKKAVKNGRLPAIKRLIPPRAVSAIDTHLGEAIVRARKLKGITQGQAATACGVRFQQIQKYERGINRMSPARLVQLCNLYEISISALFKDAPGYKGGK